MKPLLLLCLCTLFCGFSFAQTAPDYSSIKLESKEDFNDAANDAALQAANFLFSTPYQKENADRLNAMQYIIRWTVGTPDYTFGIDEQSTKFAKKNPDLLGLYMAAMTKFVLENKADAKDGNKVKLNAVKTVIAYAKDPKNNLKANGELKKAMEADEKGQLSEYLKI